jgi:hypothetical protein
VSARQPVWIVARRDNGWLARLVLNGRDIMGTRAQLYADKRDAYRAVEIVAGHITRSPFADWPEVHMAHYELPVEVREVDERTGEPT